MKHFRGFSILILLAIAGVVVILDQLTKAWVLATLPVGRWWAPFPGDTWRILRITHTTNTGAAFGIFPEQSSFFILIAVVVAVAIVLYYQKLSTESWLLRISLGLQLGGAIGNLLDRLHYGYVVDFIDIGFWPIFNIADASITIGVGLIVFYLWKEERANVSAELTAAKEKVES